MATRVQQDAFMDDSDDSCPLCVEEFDLSDKNFKPCPCGYQVCQFCYNNIKNNMNGLCPACRRLYDEKNIEWKVVSPEEQKADIALQARKKAMARQKESERKQFESLNRKHLAGLRVVQKNLVYVVGLNPKSKEEDLLKTLRGDQYFGQYGQIVKIVVSKAKENASGNSSIGVYVTFARKQDAASCIAAVDGSQNGDRTLRAQYGTTKYCSVYLRNETCNNRQCMFLHEQGEDHDSFSRQDLSSINAVSTQRPAPQPSSSSLATKPSQQPPQPQPPPQQAPQVVTAASHSVARHGSRDEPMSRSDSGDGSALPSSASWAAKNIQGESRRSSKPSSVSAPSPQVTDAATVSSQPSITQPPIAPAVEQQSQPQDQPAASISQIPSPPPSQKQPHPLDRLIQTIAKSSFKFTFDRDLYSQETLREIDAFPPLFDVNGGLVRYRMEKEREKEREEERSKQEKAEQDRQENKITTDLNLADEDETPASGSLQLGGEPETDDGRHSAGERQSSEPRSAIQPPFMAGAGGVPFGSSFFGNNHMVNGRSLTPQQQQQLYLLRGAHHQSPVNNQAPQSFTGHTSQHHHQQSNPFQNQGQGFGMPGHARQTSRFTFANDTSSASTAVKPNTNPQLMAQQSAMMPSSQNKNFQHQTMQPTNIHKPQFYSGVQGPPPGLKSSGTPPISGGGMFGQGHGFTQPVGGPSAFNSLGATKNTNEQLMQNLLRGRGDTMNGPGLDVGKQTSNINPINIPPAPSTNLLRIQTPKPADVLPPTGPRSKKSTPVPTSVPPGLSLPQDFPPLAAPSIPAPALQKAQKKAGPSAASANVVKPVVPVVPSQATKGANTLFTGDGPPESPAAKGELQAKSTSSGIEPVPKPKSRKEAPPSERMAPSRLKKHSKSGEPATSSDGKPVKELPERSGQGAGKSSRELEKRHPGRLNLEAIKAKPVDKVNPIDTSQSSGQPQEEEALASTTTASAVSQPETPLTAASQASGANVGKNGQSRTIRVLPTAKNEVLPKGPATAVSRDASNVFSANLPSRRGSLSSMNPPGTPVSERISDNVSMTSTSLSRANSPPPSKVGTAPARNLTKNQQKKERQARAKQAEQAAKVDEAAVKTEVEEPVQAPIVGRKKKQKKPATRGTADTTPVGTRPPSPQPHDEDFQETEEPGPSTPVRGGKKEEAKAAVESEAETYFSPAGPSTSEQPQKNTLNAAALFSALQKSNQISSAALDIFKPVIGLNHRFDIDAQSLDHIPEVGLPTLSDEQNQQIEHSEPVCIDQGNGRCVIVLPDRRTLRGLTIEQANRYLELRKEALDTSELLHLAGHGPAPPKPPTPSSSLISSNGAHLTNPFLSESQTQAAATNVSRLPQAFGSVGSANPTTYVDEAAAFIATRREKAGGVMGVEDAEQAFAGSRKETEGLEKRLNALLKRNRRLVLGSVGN